MTKPIRNPFYVLLLIACAMLLVTAFVYLVGWMYVPHPDRPAPSAPMPPVMRWIDRHALWLIIGEVSAILVLTVLTIGLDGKFDRSRDESSKRTESDEPTEVDT